MVELIKCNVCFKEYPKRGIHTHMERAHGTLEEKAKYSSGYNGKYNDIKYLNTLKTATTAAIDKKYGAKISKILNCFKCGVNFSLIEREKKHKDKYFCSKTCANTHTIKLETRIKMRQIQLNDETINEIKTTYCRECSLVNPVTHLRYCSEICKSTANIKRRLGKRKEKLEQMTAIAEYRRLCNFKFNIVDYPDEFDFNLVELHGWYKPTNKGNNLTGISKDHIISVKYGFKNKVDPVIMSHPANCKLMIHNHNVSKYDKSDISLDDLILKIENWNSKY